MATYSNINSIPLSLAVWLANDTYDHVKTPNYISATGLLKPLKAIILGRSIPIQQQIDLSDLIASKLGTAVHESIEQSWIQNYKKALKKLGHPDKIIQNIVINPSGPIPKEAIPIHMEIRSTKEVGGYTVGGKFDFVIEEKIEDFKTTGTYSWITQSNRESYILQGSIYRWLNPDIIKNDHIAINYIFTDWTAAKAIQDKTYPKSKILQQDYPLMSLEETQQWIERKLSDIDKYTGIPQKNMPQCSQEELWQKDPTFKYFKNPDKRLRSTKNFTSLAEANMRLHNEGVGVVVEVPAEVKRCTYCSSRPICQQAESLELMGLLK